MQNEPDLIIDEDGNKFWYLNGNRHREDGPAIELSNGDKYWFLNSNKYSFEEWIRLTPLSEKEKLKLRLKYGQYPCIRNR